MVTDCRSPRVLRLRLAKIWHRQFSHGSGCHSHAGHASGGVATEGNVLDERQDVRRIGAPLLASGKIHILLLGEKLRGGFSLVKIQRRSMKSSRRDHWLLIKNRDEYADPSWDIESARLDRSVLTGRGLKEIKEEGMGELVQATLVPEWER